jgi:general secretion pathway protein K
MNFKPNKASVHQQSGAALLAVLIVAVALVLLLNVVSTTLNSRLVLAQQSKDKLLDQAAVYAKLNELVYLASTAQITVAGLSQGTVVQIPIEDEMGFSSISPIGDELRVDGYEYEQEDGLVFSIQNQAGLIPVNSREQYWLKRWLAGYGLSTIKQNRFGDILADYADPDTWRRPSGAEQASYKNQQFAAPANFLLQSCSELWKLVDWPTLLQSHPALLQQCSLARGGSVNLNAVPENLWRILWPNSADKVSAQRQLGKWLVSDNDILTIEPALLSIYDDYFSILGGKIHKLRVFKNSEIISWDIEKGSGLAQPFTIRKSPNKVH